ncbi:hypothetical protein Dimus_013089 [Dionaea muscipula]
MLDDKRSSMVYFLADSLPICLSAVSGKAASRREKAMGSTFNPQILVDKLAKLNNSQQSIETLSHWCIFHMNKARQVVETWERQFHCSPRDQRLAFLYLANDILQNSRRKGVEFVGEFWRVLPEALRDMIRNGDEFGRNAALRLINIWEERKVFGSRGYILREEFVGRQSENSSKNGKQSAVKLRPSAGSTLDKIVSGYEVIYGGQLDEDAILGKCRNAISFAEKMEKDIGSDMDPVQAGHLSGFVKELQGHNTVLRECIEQLSMIEASRAALVSNLREALHEQELKLDQVQNQLQAAQLQSEQAANICQQLLNSDNVQLLGDQSLQEDCTAAAPPGFVPEDLDQPAPVVYTRQLPFPEKPGEEDPRKSAAAAVAAKLTASTSSAQMLTYVLSSLAQEGVIGNAVKESSSSSDYPSEKRPKLENDQSSYVPSPSQPPPLPPFPSAGVLQQNAPGNNGLLTSDEQPHPPASSPPPLPPLPPLPPFSMPQFMQTAAPLHNLPYSFGVGQPAGLPLAGYPPIAPPVSGISPFPPPLSNTYQAFQGSEGGFYGQPSSMPMTPISRQ